MLPDDATLGQMQADDDEGVAEQEMDNRLLDEKDAIRVLPMTHEKADMLIALSTVPGGWY